MNKAVKESLPIDLKQEGAAALLSATFEFLRRNDISNKSIVDFARRFHTKQKSRMRLRGYCNLQSAYEEMGIIMATWFSKPAFLDISGNPVPISKGTGTKSLAHLIRVARARIDPSKALKLMSQSPSVKSDRNGNLIALRRVFVLPELEVPRAAFVVERYLDTLQRNALARRKESALLLERSCHVSEVDLSVIAPLLRDIEGRGTAFMDLIDGEIEGRRLRPEGRKAIGEMGVLVFAWKKPGNQSFKNQKVPFERRLVSKVRSSQASTKLVKGNSRV